LLRKHCGYGGLCQEMDRKVPVSDNKFRNVGWTLRAGSYYSSRTDRVCRQTVMGFKLSYIAFTYKQKWLGKFITGLEIKIPLLPSRDFKTKMKTSGIFIQPNLEQYKVIIRDVIHIRDTLENNSFYRISSDSKVYPTDAECLGNYEELFKYLSSKKFFPSCTITYRHINDPKKHVSLSFNVYMIDSVNADIRYYAYDW
jgi:hypothetical protein